MSGRKIFDGTSAGRLLTSARGFVPLRDPCVVAVWLDDGLGLLSIEHDGTIGFDACQAIKDMVWGREAAAIEVYPPASRLVDNLPMRHLWLLGPDDFWPDLGREGAPERTRLIERYAIIHAGGRE